MQPDDHSRDQHKQNLAAEVLRTTGLLRMAANGYSMLPTLWPGDLLTVKSLNFDQVQAGDVVLFTRDERFFIHRVLRKSDLESGKCLRTRGDGMPEEDAPVHPEEFLGKVVSTEYGEQKLAIPACSGLRRHIGLLLAYSGRLRSLALRCHAWRGRRRRAILSAPEVRSGRSSAKRSGLVWVYHKKRMYR